MQDFLNSTLVLPLAFSKVILIWAVFLGLAIAVLVKGLRYNPYKVFESEVKSTAKVNKAYSDDHEDAVRAVVASKIVDSIREDRLEDRRVLSRLERDADVSDRGGSLRPVMQSEALRREDERSLVRLGNERPQSRVGSERPVLMSDIASDKPVVDAVKEAVKEVLEQQQQQHPVAAIPVVEAVVEQVK